MLRRLSERRGFTLFIDWINTKWSGNIKAALRINRTVFHINRIWTWPSYTLCRLTSWNQNSFKVTLYFCVSVELFLMPKISIVRLNTRTENIAIYTLFSCVASILASVHSAVPRLSWSPRSVELLSTSYRLNLRLWNSILL